MEEKRQITAVVASTLNGDLLPLQLIFTGQDKNRKQQKAVPKLDVKTQRYIDTECWQLTQTHNHWSTFDSMMDYLHGVVAPFVARAAAKLGVSEPHCVLLMDCWSVHKSADFLQWLGKAYPRFHPVFVPAGCTGKAQPADLMLQRPLKARVVEEYTMWMTREIGKQLKVGATPDKIKVNVGMVRLKPLLVEWMVSSWDKLRTRTALIKKGWEMAGLSAVFDARKQMEALRLIALNQLAEADGEEEEPEAVVAAADTDSDSEDEEKEA
jgi:hypothetical protein